MIKVPRLIFGDFILNLGFGKFTAQKIKFSITDLFSKCDQIPVMENFIFCAVLTSTMIFMTMNCWHKYDMLNHIMSYRYISSMKAL